MRQHINQRLSRIPVIRPEEQDGLERWLRGEDKYRFAKNARGYAVYLHGNGRGRRTPVQGDWTQDAMIEACKNQYHYILLRDGRLRQAPSDHRIQLPVMRPGEEFLQYLSSRTISALSVRDDGSVFPSLRSGAANIEIKGLYYRDIREACNLGRSLLTTKGYVRQRAS